MSNSILYEKMGKSQIELFNAPALVYLVAEKEVSPWLLWITKKTMDFHKFMTLTGTKRVSMAQPEYLQEQLGLAPGIISPFGLLNNEAHNVKAYFDKDIFDEPIQTFHPNKKGR